MKILRDNWDWKYTARVVKIVDADTLDMDLDLGAHVHVVVRVRLAWIDAPAAKTDAGKAATAWVTDWLTAHADVDGVLVVTTTKDRTEVHGRYLGKVTGADGADLAADMLAAGHAVPWDGRGPHPAPDPAALLG